MNIHATPLIAFILADSHSDLLHGRVRGGGTKEPASFHRHLRCLPTPEREGTATAGAQSHAVAPSLRFPGQAHPSALRERLPPRRQAPSRPQRRGGQSTWSSTAGFHPCTVPPAAGTETEWVSGTQHGGEGALPTSISAAFLAHH